MLVLFTIPSVKGFSNNQSVVCPVIGFRCHQGLERRWLIDARVIRVSSEVAIAEVYWKDDESLLDIAGRTVRVFGLTERDTYPPISS